MDHKYISNTSSAPAATNSLAESIAKQLNCTGLGEAKVRKFRYLRQNGNIIAIPGEENHYCRNTHLAISNARTVPSVEADTRNLRLLPNFTADTAEVWSVNVIKQ